MYRYITSQIRVTRRSLSSTRPPITLLSPLCSLELILVLALVIHGVPLPDARSCKENIRELTAEPDGANGWAENPETIWNLRSGNDKRNEPISGQLASSGFWH